MAIVGNIIVPVEAYNATDVKVLTGEITMRVGKKKLGRQ